RRGDRPRRERGGGAPRVRGRRLAGPRTAGPRARRLASTADLHPPDLAEALRGVDFVQENGPERLDFKQELYARIDALLPPDVIVASSSSGLPMSEIQKGARRHPDRCVIGHPFNPPHVIPLVEVVGGEATSEAALQRAEAFYAALGKRTVRIRKELP